MSDIPDEQTFTSIDLFSPVYCKSHNECLLCIYQYFPEYKEQIKRFEQMLEQENMSKGCGVKTCIQTILETFKDDKDMAFILQIPVGDLSKHFDDVFGNPFCGYNRKKTFDFFSLFDESNVNNTNYIDFIFRTYKYSRSTSVCPYALAAVFVYYMIENSIEGLGDFKKKHDYLWMYNCLCSHQIRLGKLK